MFLILVLIILLNKMYAYIPQDSEIILLPAWNLTGTKEILLTLKVFGKLILLNLRRNDQIISPMFKVWKYDSKDITKKLLELELKASNSCFYFHANHISSAVINFCQENGLEGFVFVENDILKIQPIPNKFAPFPLDDSCVKEEGNISFGKSHLITTLHNLADLNLYHWDNFKPKERPIRNTQEKLTIELAVFFDEAAYRIFMPLLDNDIEKIRCMLLLYVNGIQAAFRHPSLGISIDISLVRLDIMKKQPPDLPVVDKTNVELLDSFCTYAKSRNFPDDNPHHWDIGLYLTGLDLYKYSTLPILNKFWKIYNTAGSSRNDGACIYDISCAIIEFHAESKIISSGLRSSSTAVHEIGHVLGLPHDEVYFDKNPNERYKHIMSPLKTNQRQIIWSASSFEKIKGLWQRKRCLRDHVRLENFDTYVFNNLSYSNLSGREWTAKAQCEVLLQDKDANVVTLHDICQSLQCETPHKDAYYFMGLALDGTHCALGKECRRGECVPVIEPPYIFKYCEDDNWSEWKKDSCKSGCLMRSKGTLQKRRFCKHQTHRTANCIGPYYDVILCDDSSFCENRKTIAEYTTIMCTKFNSIMSELKIGPGWQAPHQVDKPWVACTVHCFTRISIYAPRLEMLNYGFNPYFPDGTWCHNKNNQNYYCRQHHCLPQNYSFKE